MRLAVKFALAFVAVAIVGWGAASWYRVGREIELFDDDMQRDHASVSVDLVAAVSDIWSLGGESRAREFVVEANDSKGHVSIDLVTLDPASWDTLSPLGQATRLISRADTTGPVHLTVNRFGHEWLYTYVIVPVEDASPIAIELAESLDERDAYVRGTIIRAVIFTTLAGLLAGGAALVLGLYFVGRPVRSMVGMTRRIAGGDLAARVALRQGDELGRLGEELNAMGARLLEAREQVAIESSARRTTLEQLRHADRLTTAGTLAAAIAHELNSPLTVVRAYAKMIVDGELADREEVVDASQMILRQANQMAKITRGLLDLSRRPAPSKESVDLRAVVEQTADVVEPFARKRKVRVHRWVDATEALVVADPDQVRQIVSNLMMNAVDAMPAGGHLTVALEYRDFEVAGERGSSVRGQAPLAVKGTDNRRAGRYAVISVADTGVGIAPEHLDSVFDPFFTTKDRGNGTGLGLSIVAEIAREHGGWIELASRVGQGTTFLVWIPME